MARSGYAKGASKGKATEQRERPARPAAKKMVCSWSLEWMGSWIKVEACMSLYAKRTLNHRYSVLIYTVGHVTDLALQRLYPVMYIHVDPITLCSFNPILFIPLDTIGCFQALTSCPWNCSWSCGTFTIWASNSRHDQDRRICCWQTYLQIRQASSWISQACPCQAWRYQVCQCCPTCSSGWSVKQFYRIYSLSYII